MEYKLSFWNWSIKELLLTHSDTFSKAKIKILYTVLLLSIFKVVVAVYFSWFAGQNLQLGRAVILMIIYTLLIKSLLNNTIKQNVIAHTMLTLGLILVTSNILFFSQTVNLISLQFVFMVTLSSFYLLGIRFGIIYSGLAILPILFFMISGSKIDYFPNSEGALASPAFEIIAISNFITIIFSHYLFQQAFLGNVVEKEVLNDKLKKVAQEANETASMKSNFLSTMSHELRTPLNSVLGMTDLFLDNPKERDKVENLKILKFSANSLNAVINDILDFNKLGSDKLKLESIDVNLYELIHDICSGLTLQASEKGIITKLDIDDDVKDVIIHSDPTRITQIFYNLISNAVKFTSKGSVTVQLKVISQTEKNIKIQFSVIDTGIGIKPNQQEKIFEPFSQASTSTTRNYGGTGLGLPIVKQLLALFGSKIYLKSEPNKGSTFYFDISFHISKKKQVVDFNNQDGIYDLSNLRILAAEDNLMNRLLLKKVLSQWNNEPVFAENGEEAINLTKEQNFNVILMDLHMPVIDGYMAATAIRQLQDEQKAQIPIIAFTATVSSNLDEELQAVGINDYIYKPFNAKDLYTKLHSIAQQLNNDQVNSTNN